MSASNGCYDYIIVGAGSAGCVLANRLSFGADFDVLVLEAGGHDHHLAVKVPAAGPKLFNTELDWAYRTEPEAYLLDRRLQWVRGKTLGGSSSLNSQIYLRGHRADFDHWAVLGNYGWDYDHVLPYFVRAERNEHKTSSFHGSSGELNVCDLRAPHEATQRFIDAGVELGIVRSDDLNGPVMEGVGSVQVTQKKGLRCSSADAYLKPAMRRPNLNLLTDAQAKRVVFDGKKAVGVEYSRGGSDFVAKGRQILLCAGVVDSPKLLQLSGVGSAEYLSGLGIEVVCDLPGVGQNLQDHLGLAVKSLANDGMQNHAIRDYLLNMVLFALVRKGPLTSVGAEAVAFVRSRPDLEGPNLEFIFEPPRPKYLTTNSAAVWARLRGLLRDERVPDGAGQVSLQGLKQRIGRPSKAVAQVLSILIQPKSRGFINIVSPDYRQPPAIQANYFSDSHQEDLLVMVEGVKIARRLLESEALSSHVGAELVPGREVSDDEQIKDFIRQRVNSFQHPACTCKMGVDSAAVVDPQLRVRGVAGLRVVDASVMPVITRGHLNASTIMIAEKAADLIREDPS